jgi:hypothetical protein
VSGSLLLTGKQRPHLGFKADVIGFSDTSERPAGAQRVDRRTR